MFASKIQTALIMIGTGLIVGSLTAWWATDHYHEIKIERVQAEHQAQIEYIQTESIRKIRIAEQAKSRAEGALKDEKSKLIQDHSERVASLNADIRNLRLRDPGAKGNGSGACPANGNSPGTPGDSGTPAGDGLLSEQATEFLWGFATEADRTLETLRTCQAWVRSIEGASTQYAEDITSID